MNQYRVVLEVQSQFQDSLQDLRNVYLRSAQGGQVPLSAFIRVEHATAPLTINHQGQFPVVTVSFNLAPALSLGEAVPPSRPPGKNWVCRRAFTPAFRARPEPSRRR